MKSVNKGLKVRLYPDNNLKHLINQNIGNARFVWNHLLSEYEVTRNLFLQHGYTKLRCNMTTFNAMLNMLKKTYSFLYLSESSSLQQVYRDLINAFNKFFNEGAGHPRFKSKRNSKKSFRIQNNGNIKFTKNTVILPKIGEIFFRTSFEYKKLLKTAKINNVTVKKDKNKYYAIFNVETIIDELPYRKDVVGIDLGIRTLATLSNGLKIANLDVSHEDSMIRKCQKKLSTKIHGSSRYNKILKTYWKYVEKKKNKIEDAYHKFSHYLVEYYDVIIMENLNIRGWFKTNLSSSLQTIALYKLLHMIEYKSKWHGRRFAQINRWFPSSQLCNFCKYQYQNLGRDEREWTCPICESKHDRDINAAQNILKEGLRLLFLDLLNLWDTGDGATSI